ncbi:PKD-like family lipoprotein [Parapedobacter tibetensis]|uniref:PKD-like family lipoprotein n=1 Tax=Parapedobacter tibetensis TaxID=2972951 RepID=UPI00214D90FF|nr:PKD-like family lipoprotein [Parapedobacter tibetensis]
MTRYFSSFIFGLSALLLTVSCSKDLGNYDYHDINELAITGVESTYSVLTGVDTLHIEPEIAATEADQPDERYDYFWILRGSNQFVDTVGTERALDYPIDLAPETFTLHFRTVDKQTGVAWWTNSDLVVGTPYSRGLLLIGENEQGQAEAEMISMVSDTLHIPNILSNSGLPALTDPVGFLHTGGYYVKMWVLTRSGSYYLDRMTMKSTPANQFGSLVYTTDPIQTETLDPIVIAPQIGSEAGATGQTWIRAVLCSDGSVFVSYTLLNGGDFYPNPMNRTSDDPDRLLKAAPYLLYSIGSLNAVMWYDSENERFMNISNIGLSTSSTVLTDGASDPFPWNQAAAGRILVYAENTRNTDGGSVNGNSFAITKDGNNRHYIYKFYANGANPAKHAAYTVLPMATDFDKADFYAFSSNRTVVFYSVGNKLYAYDYNPGNERIYPYPTIGTDEITMLKFDTQIDHLTNSLYIATYGAGTKGTLRRFIVGSNPNVVELTPAENGEWNNLINVTNMSWRAAN